MNVLMDAAIADPAAEDWQDVLLWQVLWFEVKARRDLGDDPARYAAIIDRFERVGRMSDWVKDGISLVLILLCYAVVGFFGIGFGW